MPSRSRKVRKAPKESATLFKVGHIDVGFCGIEYIVKTFQTQTGRSKRWVRLYAKGSRKISRKSRRSRKISRKSRRSRKSRSSRRSRKTSRKSRRVSKSS